MLRNRSLLIPIALLSAGILAACQPAHTRGTKRSTVLTQDIRPDSQVYRTSDGQIFLRTTTSLYAIGTGD